MEGQKKKKSIFVEPRVEWQENRSLGNVRRETIIFQAEEAASAHVPGAGEEPGALQERNAEWPSTRRGREG